MALIAEYGFPEGSGSTTADSSGNNRTLAVSGSWAAAAKNGPGLGSGGAAVGAMGPNTAQTAYTIMAWVKLSLPAAGSYYGIVTSTVAAKFLEVQASGAALLMDFYGGSTLTATSTFPVNTATHLAVTVTGTTTGTLYINGVAAGTGAVTVSSTANFSQTDHTIGVGNGNIAPGASDWIDEVRIFDTALTSTGITTWMNTAVLRPRLITSNRQAIRRAANW